MRSLILVPLVLAACSHPSRFVQPANSAALAPGEPMVLVRSADGCVPPSCYSPYEFGRLALSADDLFFSVSFDGLYRMPKYGGPIELVDQTNDSYNLFAAANGEVYWTHGTRILARAVNGGPSRVLYQSKDQFNPGEWTDMFQADNTYVYFATWDREQGNDLVRVPISGGAPTTLLHVPPLPVMGSYNVGWIQSPQFIVDHEDVFVLSYDSRELDVIRAGSTVAQKLADMPGGVDLLLGVQGDTVYLREYSRSTNLLVRVPRTGGAATTTPLPSDSIPELGFAVDDRNVYVFALGRFFSMPNGGGAPTPICRDGVFDDGGIDSASPPLRQDAKNLFILKNRTEVVMLPKTPAGTVQ